MFDHANFWSQYSAFPGVSFIPLRYAVVWYACFHHQQGHIQAKNSTGQLVWVPQKCPQKTKVANLLTT